MQSALNKQRDSRLAQKAANGAVDGAMSKTVNSQVNGTVNESRARLAALLERIASIANGPRRGVALVALALVTVSCREAPNSGAVPAATLSSSTAPNAVGSTPSRSAASTRSSTPPRDGARPNSATAGSDAAAAKHALRTTSPAVALENFRAQLANAERRAKTAPADLGALSALVSAHLEQASRLGVLSSFETADAASKRALAAHPKNPAAHMLRASVYAALHHFDEADRALALAEKLGAPQGELEQARATLAMARGHYDEAFASFDARAKSHGDTVSSTLLAICLGHMQRTAESDAKFEAATEAFHDTSPFVLAWVEFERGAMWERAGDEARARQYYRQAVTRLPAFAHAVGHLAALLPPAEAKTLLEGVARTSDDPEYLATLATVEDALAAGSGRAHREEAARGYEVLMKKYPLAFADHAGWYYLNVAKDAEHAVTVAAQNLRNRRSSQAFELMIAAETAAALGPEACEHADEALALPYVSRGVVEAALGAYRACGTAARAEELDRELARRTEATRVAAAARPATAGASATAAAAP